MSGFHRGSNYYGGRGRGNYNSAPGPRGRGDFRHGNRGYHGGGHMDRQDSGFRGFQNNDRAAMPGSRGGFGVPRHHTEDFQRHTHQKKRKDYQPNHSPSAPAPISRELWYSQEDSVTEAKERGQLYETLMKEKDLKTRLTAFAELKNHQKLCLFLPNDVSLMSLPPQEPPANWAKRLQVSSKQQLKNIESQLDAEGMDNDYDSEDEAMGIEPGDHCHVGSNERRNQELISATYFLNALQHCPPLYVGFLSMPITAQSTSQWCYCPCGRHMAKWRQFMNLIDIIPQCEHRGKRAPRETLDHIQTKGKDCIFHKWLFEFLELAFADFYERGPQESAIRHIAFEFPKSKPYRKTQERIDFIIQGQVKKLLDEKLQVEESLAQKSRLLDRLQETNKALGAKLQAKEDLLKELQAVKEEELSKEKEMFALERVKTTFGKLNKQYVSSHEEMWPKLAVPVGSKLSRLFRKWSQDRSGNFDFLFADFPKDKEETFNLRKKVLARWNISFDLSKEQKALVKTLVCKEEKELFEKETAAKDDGGPSREFFSRVWNELPDLRIKEFKLFEATPAGLVPIEDDTLEYTTRNFDGILLDIKRYYRAIGRMMTHCLLLSPEHHGPIPVASHVLPRLYRTILLRDLDVSKQKEYFTATLIHHICEILEVEVEDREKAAEQMRMRLWLDDTTDIASAETKMRTVIKKRWIEERRIALNWLKSGLFLEVGNPDEDDSQIPFDGLESAFTGCFGHIPTESLSRMLFADLSSLADESLFLDSPRGLIQFKGEDNIKMEESIRQTQDLFKSEVRGRFRSKQESEEGKRFISEFVRFCTGFAYLPDLEMNEKFRIYIEFNQSELSEGALPHFHTCTKEMVIPWTAYNANMEVFERKLQQAMGFSGTGFNME